MGQTFDPVGGRCLGGNQPGAVVLMEATIAYFPPAYNLGLYVCRKTRDGRANSVHSEGRAGDSGFRLVGGKPDPRGQKCADWLVAKAQTFGVQTVIWDREIWSLARPYWRTYTGPHPHDNHVHWELNWWGAKNLTRKLVEEHRPGQPEPQPTPPEEEDVRYFYWVTGEPNTYWVTDLIHTRKIAGTTDFGYTQPRCDDLGEVHPDWHASLVVVPKAA